MDHECLDALLRLRNDDDEGRTPGSGVTIADVVIYTRMIRVVKKTLQAYCYAKRSSHNNDGWYQYVSSIIQEAESFLYDCCFSCDHDGLSS